MAERAHNPSDHVWSVTEASESLDALLDDVESTGEQMIERAGRTFRVMEGGKAGADTRSGARSGLVRAFLEEPAFRGFEFPGIDAELRDVDE